MTTGTSLLHDSALSKWIWPSCCAFLTLALLLLPIVGRAQDQASSASTSAQFLKSEQLDALVAPVALYPDDLLSLVLMASTYPLEVVEADRWVKANKNLKGDQLKAAVDKQGWDDSVKSLVAAPEALAMMSSKLDWTQKLGDAVLAQQPDVMDAIQRMRTKAEANNKLASTKQQKVSKKEDGGKQVIVIESAEPDTVYVPYYDPTVVYGAWPYPAYPPYYFPQPGYIAGQVVRTGIAFGVGFAVGRWTSGGCCWGGGFGWGGNNINRAANINVNVKNWQHDVSHRHGVRYTNANVQQKFGNTNIRNGAQNRMDFRGREGNQVLRPGGAQASLGDRAGGAGVHRPDGNRAGGVGQRRPDAGNRPARTPDAAHRSGAKPAAGAHRNGNALGNISSGGKAARAQSMRGHASLGGGRGGGSPHISRGGGRGGGGFQGGGGRGGRRSDMVLKHDIVLLAHMPNGIGFYRFSYNGSNKAFVGVIAQEVKSVMPDAVVRGSDGYLRVRYEKIGVRFQTYRQWIASGARLPDAIKAAD